MVDLHEEIEKNGAYKEEKDFIENEKIIRLQIEKKILGYKGKINVGSKNISVSVIYDTGSHDILILGKHCKYCKH